MTKDVIYSTLYADLDSLLDTRLAVLYEMGEDVIKHVLDNGYTSRDIDHWDGIDNNLFKAKYAARDKQILKNSAMTPMVTLLREFVIATVAKSVNSPFLFEPKIIINTYPYHLSDDELDMFMSTFVALTKGMAAIELVFMSIEDVTPMYVKKNLSLVIMYDYLKWLETHSANGKLKKVTCPEVSMMSVALYENPSIKLKSMQSKDKIGFFDAIEITANPLISLKLLASVHFSMALGIPTKGINS